MKLNLKMITLLTACFSQAVFAATPNSVQCPTPSAIQAVGVQKYEAGDTPGTWVVGVKANKYGTADNWTFGIVDIKASSGEAAMKIARKGLPSINQVTPPLPSMFGYGWECIYNNVDGYWTIAFTPVESAKLKG